MARTGSALALLLLSMPALADVEFYQTVDHPKVGTEDKIVLTIVVGGAAEGIKVQFPESPDFEVLSRAMPETQVSMVTATGRAPSFKSLVKYRIILRAKRPGTLTIPPSVLSTGSRTWKTEALKVEVVKGRAIPPPPPRPAQPMIPFPGFGNDPFEDLFGGGGEPDIPRSDSDVFLRVAIDRDEVVLGDQVTMTLIVYSRFELSSVDAVIMPKLEGFWSEDVESPTQLKAQMTTLGGVPYQSYLLRRRALFPMKSGTLSIDAAEADITTGYLFSSHRLHRKSNALTLKVKPLPKGASTTNVGRWRLFTEVSQTQVKLGDPVQVKVILEGRGNLKNASVPPLTGPAAVKIFEPQVTDSARATPKGQLGGRRTVEYVVVAQQTGTFVLPALSYPFFNPDTGRVEESKTDPITLTVSPGSGGSTVSPVPGAGQLDPAEKNQLVATGLKSLRHTGSFGPPRPPLFSRPWFLIFALAPVGLTAGAALLGLVRRTLGKHDPEAGRRRQIRAARRRLSAAEKIRNTGKTADFYTEVEKALVSFLEAKLKATVTGLTREQLSALMAQAAVGAEVQQRVLAVLENCDVGRFAPGMGEAAARVRALDDAATAMGAWGTR